MELLITLSVWQSWFDLRETQTSTVHEGPRKLSHQGSSPQGLPSLPGSQSKFWPNKSFTSTNTLSLFPTSSLLISRWSLWITHPSGVTMIRKSVLGSTWWAIRWSNSVLCWVGENEWMFRSVLLTRLSGTSDQLKMLHFLGRKTALWKLN